MGGISIEAYRSRIGSFVTSFHQPTEKYKIRKHGYENYPTNIPRSRKTNLFILLLIFTPLLFSIVATYPIRSTAQSYTHPLYPALPVRSDLLLPSTRSGGASGAMVETYLLQYGIQIWAASTYSVISNFQSKYLNRNRKSTGIKISHWNKGPGHLKTKIPEIKNIIKGLHPHIIGISEANLQEKHDRNLSQIEDYTLHTCPTLENPALKTSRVVVYTHRSLIVKVRTDLMCDSYSSIWLEVGLPRHKKFLVGQTYREWQLPNQNDRASLSIPEQLARWTVFLDQWVRALDSGLEVHLLGDLNINHCNWTDPSLPASNQTTKMRPLIKALFTYIMPHGVSQCVVGPTRHWPGQTPSGLDHYFTNKPEKLSPVSTQHCGGSDHMLIFATRYSRSIKSTPRYVRKRSYKNFSPADFVEAIQQVSWLDIYLSDDVNTAVELLSSKITFVLDTMAPMRTVQIRTNYAPWLSKQTVELMKERNLQQKKASESNDRDDWVRFKSLRNQINNRLKYEERNWEKAKLEECDGNPSKTWKSVKNILNWKTSGSPNQLFYKGSLISKPQELANAQNEYFIDKIELLRQDLPPPVSDPLKTLKTLMLGRRCSFSLSSVHPDEV